MSYSQVGDVREALTPGAGTTGTNTAADLSDDQITDAIAEADAVIGGFVGGTYTTPPSLVTYWSRDIAAFLATLTWRKSKDVSNDDPIVRRYQLALLQLQGIAKGNTLVPPPDQSNNEGVGYVSNQYDGSLFQAYQFDLLGNPVGGRRGW